MKELPCRIDVFTVGALGDPARGNVYQAWNPDPKMEKRMARLPGSGSFYWPSARAAYRAAGRFVKEPGVAQVKVETISGVEVAWLYASPVAGVLALLAECAEALPARDD